MAIVAHYTWLLGGNDWLKITFILVVPSSPDHLFLSSTLGGR
jgi:hypothetical protein